MSIKLIDGGRYLKDTPSWPTSRSKLDWPFDADSYMNKPIGEDATYINLQNQSINLFEVSFEHVINPANNDPFVPYYACNNGGTCAVEENRCLGTTPIRLDGTPTNVQFPTDYVLPAPFSYTDDSGCTDTASDNPMSWLIPGQNNDVMMQGGLMARCSAGGPIYGVRGNYATNLTNIKGSAYEAFGGRYGGSGICMRGLTVKAHDILSDDPIPHACALWCQAELFWWDRNDVNTQHWRWPARTSDAKPWLHDLQPQPHWDPTALVSNTIPGFVMGALVAIPMGITAESIGIQTEPGLKYFNMFQDYGGYFVNTANLNAPFHRISMAHTPEAVDAFQTRWGHVPSVWSIYSGNCLYRDPTANTPEARWYSDITTIWQNLWLVDDNGPDNIGGAGDLRTRPPAPPFVD